jgi:hypothetical protein
LEEIPSKTISSLKKLEKLSMSGNIIKEVKTDSFNGLQIREIEVKFASSKL